MNVFLDTSSLFKLFFKESGSETVEQIFIDNVVSTIYLSQITTVEFESAVWKKFRTKEIDMREAIELIKMFEMDFYRYTIIPIDDKVINDAINLIKKYGIFGLRTLDAIQLSTAVSLVNKADSFVSSDYLLNDFFKQEYLPTV